AFNLLVILAFSNRENTLLDPEISLTQSRQAISLGTGRKQPWTQQSCRDQAPSQAPRLVPRARRRRATATTFSQSIAHCTCWKPSPRRAVKRPSPNLPRAQARTYTPAH